jgi:membrane protease YdiL (CAAX protease family)
VHGVSTPSAPPSPESDCAALPAARLRHAWSLALLLASIVGWVLVVRRFGEGNVYAAIGPYACAVSLLSLALDGRCIVRSLRPRLRPIAIGVAVGVGMTALTYPAFRLASMIWLDLDASVQGLYQGARSATLPEAFGWTIATIVAEELLFRGVWPRALSQRLSARQAYAVSLTTYALAQFGTGSFIVMLMAAVCGTIWTLQRHLTGSLLSPLIAHMIWTPTVILLYPVT